MSENGIMDRPRRTTRSSLASSSAGTPGTPSSSNNPYKKPTYSSTRGESASSSKNTNGTPSSGRGRRGRGRPPGRPSVGSRGGGGHSHHHHHHTKPECIAVRVDGRRSTGGSTTSSAGGRRGATSGGRRSTYSSRHDYEYHYGSDFESDQNESEAEEDDIESEQNESDDAESISLAGDNENADSDSDYSGSLSRVTTTVSSSRLPSPPVPIWLDTEKVPDIPKLELPTSSDDLLLSREHVVRAVEVYEPLRRFHQLVRLSPFRFEDFCGALANEDQSSLLAEIHIQLLKVVIREEDANSTLFGPNEVKDSVQSVYFFVDHITWPETLRSYLESDPSWSDVFEAIDSVEYPFCGPAERIKVLGWLVDQFLTTSVVREQLLGDGNLMSEDHCRNCNRLGEVICCEQCPAVYHLECITPALKDVDDPPEEWRCPVCVKHEVAGVNDSTSEGDKAGILIRHERLGYDRHGRKYWFLVRRLLVESDDGSEVWYYSTRGQVEELLSQLDADNYEEDLVTNIRAIEDELYQQMEVTEEVTKTQNTQRRKTYLDVANGKDEGAEGGQERVTRLKSTGLYKLGQEGLFRSYTNLFITDPLAVTKGKQNEERDRRRYMSHKFSLTTASECKYGIKDLTGCPRVTQVSALRNALTHMETILPTTLMHVNWPVLRKSWLTAVQTGAKAEDFAKAMIMISACIRNAVYNPVWSESTGHVRLHRMTLMEKEERKKSEKRDKKDKDDEEDRLKAVPQFIKYTLPIRHQVYKQKGEEYRLHGRWGWIWLSNMRRCKPQDCRQQGLLAGPLKHVIQVKNEMGKVKTMLIDPSVYCKLMAKRNLTTNSKPSTPTTTPSKESVDPQQEAASIKDRADSSSSSIHEVEMKEASPPPQPKETQEQDLVQSIKTEKVDEEVEVEGEKGEDAAAKSNCVDANGAECEEKSEEKMEEAENEKAPKEEPMEVDNGSCETQSESVTETSIEIEKCPPKELQENGCLSSGDSAGEEKEEDKEKEKEKVAEENNEEKEKEESEKSSNEEPMEVEADQAEAAKEKEESSVEKNEKDGAEEVPLEKAAENGMETEADEEKEKCKETEASEPAKSPRSPTPTNTAPTPGPGTPPPTPPPQQTQPVVAPAAAAANIPAEKIDDSQGRKFKTDLINVSLGLSTPNRILYPKVARRSEYLDTLLQRRLTLMSLEEKQLNSSYGEDMVAKAKPGLVKYEEEEKKRKEEAEEYPCEEVLDDNLVLAGAYTFQCYSSECRREVKLFMKGKGKSRERLYEKICYSPMCRLKFCLQETIRIKQERLREYEKERYWKVYKEIEEKRMYTVDGTTHKIYMKKLPDGLLPALNGVATNAAGTKGSSITPGKTKKAPATKYPEISSFQYAVSKKPSILVLPQFELRKLARTAGRFWMPAGFFQNLKSGSWGWSLPCGRPVFKTAWQYKTTHAATLATAAMQLRILYASIRWDDILAKIPNTEGKHQVHTDTEIITSEILNHRIVGRFLERVQYLRKAMVVPIDAPKTIRAKMRESSEVAPSRIGLRKRKRAESPDKMEPVVTEDWVDEERLELWEIRYYGDRINRKHDRRSESSTPSASTRTKSGVAIKQPEKYDPSHNPTQHSAERKTYAPAAQSHTQQQAQQGQSQTQNPPTAAAAAAAAAATAASTASENLAKTIENVIRNSVDSSNSSPKSAEGGRTVSAVKTAELMRETLQTEMKMNRAVHLSKRDGHTKQSGSQNNATNANRQTAATPQPTASQQFQQQQSANKEAVASTPTTSKVGQVVVGKKFFASRQSANAAAPAVGGVETGILTKRPLQNTITINKGVGGAISVVKNSQPAPPPPQPVQPVVPGTTICVPITPAVSNPPITTVSATTVTTAQQQAANAAAAALAQQKFLVIRLPDGRLQVKGLLPGQTCYQTADGKIHVTMSPAQVQQLQQQQQQQQQAAAAAAAAAQQVAVQVTTAANAFVPKPAEVVTTPAIAPPMPTVTSVAASTERKIFVPTNQTISQQQVQQGSSQAQNPPTSAAVAAATTVSTASINLANAIQSVVRSHDSSSPKSEGVRIISAVKTEISETEVKMNRAVHVLKSPSKQAGTQNNANKLQATTPQPTASQQFQQQQQQTPNKGAASSPATSGAGNAKIVVSSPTSSKVGQVVVDKKLFAGRQTPSPASPVVGGLDTGILTKRPLQSTIIINKGVGGAISVVKTPQPIPPPPQPIQTVVPGSPICVPITQTQTVSNSPITTVSATTVTTPQQQQAANAAAALVQQKFLMVRLPDGRLQVKGLLPGQTCYQTGDGKIYVTMSPTQVQQIQQQPQQAVAVAAPTPPPQVAVQVTSAAAPPQAAIQVTSPATPVVAKPIQIVTTPISAPATPTVISVAADQQATRSPIKVETPTSTQVVQQLQQQQQQQQLQQQQQQLQQQQQQLQQQQQQQQQQQAAAAAAAAARQVAAQITTATTPVAAKPANVVTTPATAPATPTVTSVAADQPEVTKSPITAPTTVPTSGPPAQPPAVNNAPKLGPSKIVAQIFQTPQGPKVVIQGVNPSDLTAAQMQQLRQQIQRQLSASGIGQNAQVPTMLAGTATSTTAAATASSLINGNATSSVDTTSSTAAPAEATTNESAAVAQAPVAEPITTSSSSTVTTTQLEQKPVINQSPLLSQGVAAASLAAQQANSPIETLRSVSSSTAVPHASPTSSSPIVARSPPPTMISPAKILSPPRPLLSPSKPNATLPTIPTSPVPPPAPVQTTTPTPAPVVVARKSAPRKSPIRPNNIDSPPPILPASPRQASPQAHNNANAVSNSNCNNVAASLMQPLSSDQQVILAERRNSLKEEIMEKKKAAATRMKMNAQREIQEEKERQNALEMTNNKIEEVKRPMTTVKTAGGKRRKLDSNSEDAPGRNSSSIERGAGGSMRGRGRGPRGGGRGGNRRRKLYCVCKTPYDKDKFYVGCDKCDNWFHGDCIGITEEMSRDLPEYICDDCRDDKLYCFCKKPYNESQFYIQCDKCDDWFHGRCVGVLQGEAESIGDYSCPGCEPDSPINFPNMKKLDTTDYLSITRVLKELLQNRSSIPFRKPVTKSQAPNYFSIIKEPIDLQMVGSRVEDRKYERLKDFVGDVGKIFENCRYYNDQTTDIFRYADNLEKFFVQKICAVRQTFNTRVR